MLASEKACLQLFWTKLSRTATLRRSKASIALFGDLYLVMSPLLATLRVGLIVLLTLQIMVQVTPSAAYVQVWVVPSPVEARWTSLYKTFKKTMKLVKNIRNQLYTKQKGWLNVKNSTSYMKSIKRKLNTRKI